MRIFTGLFGKASEDRSPAVHQWLESEEGLEELIRRSQSKPIVLFKHSTRCNISSMAKDRIERHWDFSSDELEIHYLDLITFRDVSNKIAEVFDVRHESPQVILVKDGSAIYNTSHSDISVQGLREALKGIA